MGHELDHKVFDTYSMSAVFDVFHDKDPFSVARF